MENNPDQDMFRHRDAKVIPHLEQYAPVWIVNEKLIPSDDSIQFNVVFRHSRYGWVNRRYRYDNFNDVLYHKGQKTISEEEAVEIQDSEPYIKATVTDIPNSYGG